MTNISKRAYTSEKLNRANNILRTLQSIHHDFPLLYALCLIEIACDEGMSMTDLSRKVGAPLSTISRAIGALSDTRQRGKAYGLVNAIPCLNERRKKLLSLSSQGHIVIQSIINVNA